MKPFLALFLLLASSLDAQQTKDVRLLVIVDGFREAQQDYYTNTIIPYLTDQAFDLVEGTSAANLIVEPRYLPTTTTIGISRLGLRYNGLQEKCYFDYDEAVLKAVHDQAGNFRPDKYLVILAGKGSGGCADGTTMFVRENVPREIVAHEMGHAFAGLFDEYGADPGQPSACIRWRNCTSNPGNPPWQPSTILGTYPGCDGFSSFVFHPARVCLMSTTADMGFCPVCADHLDTALRRGISLHGLELSSSCGAIQPTQIWTPPPVAGDGALDVIAVVTENDLTVLSRVELPLAERSPEVITGNVLAVATRGGTIVAIKPLSIDGGDVVKMTARSGIGTFERRVARRARLIRFTLFGVNLQQVSSGVNLSLTLYYAEDARSSFYVDDRTIQKFVPSGVIRIYDLGQALRATM